MSTHWNNEHFKGREFVPGTIGILFLLLSLTHSPQRTQSWNDAGGGTVLLLLCWRAPFVGAVLWQWSNAAALQQLIKQQWWSFSTSVGCFNENTLKLSVLICWGNNVWNGPHAVDITSLKALSKAWWNHYYYYHFIIIIIIFLNAVLGPRSWRQIIQYLNPGVSDRGIFCTGYSAAFFTLARFRIQETILQGPRCRYVFINSWISSNWRKLS